MFRAACCICDLCIRSVTGTLGAPLITRSLTRLYYWRTESPALSLSNTLTRHTTSGFTRPPLPHSLALSFIHLLTHTRIHTHTEARFTDSEPERTSLGRVRQQSDVKQAWIGKMSLLPAEWLGFHVRAQRFATLK